jgi:4-hydroxybenzoyl-CoA thioesterase
MKFRHETVIRFAHVDAAGIVFYPRYFELLNAAVEDWFAAMGRDFATLHLDQRIGTPTVALECQFIAPGRLGDPLSIDIAVERVGTSSCRFAFAMHSDGTARLNGIATLVCINLGTGKSRAWPSDIAAAMQRPSASDGNDGMA